MIIQVNSFLYQYFMTSNNFAMKSDNEDDDNWGEGKVWPSSASNPFDSVPLKTVFNTVHVHRGIQISQKWQSAFLNRERRYRKAKFVLLTNYRNFTFSTGLRISSCKLVRLVHNFTSTNSLRNAHWLKEHFKGTRLKFVVVAKRQHFQSYYCHRRHFESNHYLPTLNP